jgi:hypothetical protein
MAASWIADFEARMTPLDAGLAASRARPRGGRMRLVPGRSQTRPIVPRSLELLSRERKATMREPHRRPIVRQSLELLSRKRKAAMREWHMRAIVPRSPERSDSLVSWAEAGRKTGGIHRRKSWRARSLRRDRHCSHRTKPRFRIGPEHRNVAQKAFKTCHFVPLFGRCSCPGDHPNRPRSNEFAGPRRS